MGIKKGTKLTDKPKDFMLRVRLDQDTVSKLDTVCKVKGKSRSEIVREAIELQYKQTKNNSDTPL